MNSRQRYKAKRAAEHRERKEYCKRIDRAFSRLSEDCSNRVLKATSLIAVRETDIVGSCCLPEVAMYSAGFRRVRKDATHIIK